MMQKIKVKQLPSISQHYYRRPMRSQLAPRIHQGEKAPSAPNCYIQQYLFQQREHQVKPIDVVIEPQRAYYRKYIYPTPWSGTANDILKMEPETFELKVNNVEEVDFSHCQYQSSHDHRENESLSLSIFDL